MNARLQRVALVAPFFGRDLRGRKERYAFALATHLHLEGVAIDVVTTTARNDAPDENAFRSGVDHTEPFPVYRFRISALDRPAYAEALLAVEHDAAALRSHERALVDERVRSPELVAHVRAVADAYEAFLFVDATAATTVRAIGDVAENALLVPLLDDTPLARLPVVIEALKSARLLLCATSAETDFVVALTGSAVRARTRVLGLGFDLVPADDAACERVRRAVRGAPYVLTVGEGDGEDPRLAGIAALPLQHVEERDRAAAFACARAVAVLDERLVFVPEVAEAWSYGKAVLASAAAHGAAALVRESGAGAIVDAGASPETIAALIADDATLERLGAAGRERAAASDGWRGMALRTSEAVDAIAALDDGRSRAALLAQIAYLYPLVQRQRRAIEAMRVSRFWRLRDTWFATRRRLGIGPETDPIPLVGTDERAAALAAIGDRYQLFREQHRLRPEDVERIRAIMPFLSRAIAFGMVIDVRRRGVSALATTLRSLSEQLLRSWQAAVLVPAGLSDEERERIASACAGDPRIRVVAADDDRYGEADFVGPLDPGDTLEPHALFECALALQADDADVVYSDEDRLDDAGVPSDPWFKPDWSPETALTRDYVGRLLFFRRTALEAVGGVRDVLESARWYDALLRITECTERVRHLPQVLCHRLTQNLAAASDLRLAAEAAVRRRGEPATVLPVAGGIEVRYANEGERVAVVIPTRDRADLLGACLNSIFGRTTYGNFEVIVVDNGSREPETHLLLAEWAAREPARFRILRDGGSFNYPRLNNEAVAATDAPFVLLLNNDTEVLAPDWMEAMLGQARRPAIGAVGALLLYDDDSVQHAGVLVGVLGFAGHAHRFTPASSPGYHGALQLDTNYLAVTAACLMVERRKYLEVGQLDEAFAVSSNDVDFCLRLRAAGYRNVFVPRARLRHYESKTRGTDTTPGKVARTLQETGLVRERWPSWAQRDPYYNPNLTLDAEDFDVRL